jgi:hypothetical protein
MDRFTRDQGRSSPSLDEQLDTLASCGVKLAEGVDRREVVGERSPSDFEADPFRLAIAQMAHLSNDLWHFDTECIEGPGAYVSIAASFAALAQGDLPLQAIEDGVDIENDEAWIQFMLDGQTYRWEAAVEGDWVDATILGRFAALLTQRTAGRRRFTYIDHGGGQDCIIGCSTPEQLEQLREKTGLEVTWLT